MSGVVGGVVVTAEIEEVGSLWFFYEDEVFVGEGGGS